MERKIKVLNFLHDLFQTEAKILKEAKFEFVDINLEDQIFDDLVDMFKCEKIDPEQLPKNFWKEHLSPKILAFIIKGCIMIDSESEITIKLLDQIAMDDKLLISVCKILLPEDIIYEGKKYTVKKLVEEKETALLIRNILEIRDVYFLEDDISIENRISILFDELEAIFNEFYSKIKKYDLEMGKIHIDYESSLFLKITMTSKALEGIYAIRIADKIGDLVHEEKQIIETLKKEFIEMIYNNYYVAYQKLKKHPDKNWLLISKTENKEIQEAIEKYINKEIKVLR